MQEREAELREELLKMYETKLREHEEHLRRQQEEQLRRQQEEEFRQQEEQLRRQQEEQLRRQQEEEFRQQVQQTLEDTLMIRFPAAPLALIRDIRRIQRPSELHRLIVAVQQVPDLAAAEELLHAAARQAGNGG
jgi:FMN phosphatase YigB (HAD superfamily)